MIDRKDLLLLDEKTIIKVTMKTIIKGYKKWPMIKSGASRN